MKASANVIVTVADGCHFTIAHPSGIPELGFKTVSGGEEVAVSRETAADLFRARLINDPATGQPPVQFGERVVRRAGPSISVFGGPMRLMENGLNPQPSWAATADFGISTEDRAPKPPPHNCNGPTIDLTKPYGGR